MKSILALFAAVLTASALVAAPPEGTPTPASTPAPGPTFALSLQDAVKMALENNPDIIVEKLGPEAGHEGIRQAQGAYDPLLTSTLLETHRTDPGTSIFAGGSNIKATSFEYDFGAQKLFATGGSLRLGFTNSRATTTATTAIFNPTFNSNLTLSLNQPLLRNFFNDNARQQLQVAKNNAAISDAQFQQVVVNAVATVKQQYYELLYNMDNLEAQRKSLGLAQQLLNENQIRVRVGTLAPLDVVQAESEVAGREQGVILAEAALADAQDALKRSIFPRTRPDTWDLTLVPTDRPSADPVKVDARAAIEQALKNRSDMAIARKNLETAEMTASYARNQTRPALDLVASYGSVGTGGTQLRDPSQGFTGGLLTTPVAGGYSDALSSVFGRDFPTWTVGVNFSYPLGNRAASGRAASARIDHEQAELSLRRLELDVAVEVRRAARAVESNFKSVEATRAARVLQEQRLDAENKRFAAGMSTNFLVTQAQRDLASAQVAEIRATADYNESLVNFDRVQQAAGVSIVSSSRSTSGGSSTTSGSTPTGTGGVATGGAGSTTGSGTATTGSSTSTTTTTGGPGR